MKTNAETAQPPLRVLVVEDHADTLESILRGLRRLGHHATGAAGMEEARLTARDAPFDLLISDIMLPDGDGWELLRRLRAEECEPGRAIAMSIYNSVETQRGSEAAGYGLHLKKPFSFVSLRDALQEVLEG